MHLGRAEVVLGIVTEVGVVDVVDEADDCFGVPGHPHLTVGITGSQ